LENRQFHRLLLQVDIIHHRKSEKMKKKAKTKDISLGGICITSYDEMLNINEIYILQFTLPGKKWGIRTTGRVVCCRKYVEGDATFYDNGIEFVKLNNKCKKMIEEYSIGSVKL